MGALEGLTLEALGVVVTQRAEAPEKFEVSLRQISKLEEFVLSHRLGRCRHHGRWRGPGHRAAPSWVRELEAELQEELLGLPEKVIESVLVVVVIMSR